MDYCFTRKLSVPFYFYFYFYSDFKSDSDSFEEPEAALSIRAALSLKKLLSLLLSRAICLNRSLPIILPAFRLASDGGNPLLARPN